MILACPKCESLMDKVEFGRIEVDRCTACGGVWFDDGEQRRLKEMTGSETIDSGGPEAGSGRERAAEEMECPKDGSRLKRRVDSEQAHIEYEQCPKCRGVFFDAGEFRDFKDFTVGEKMVAWFTGSPSD